MYGAFSCVLLTTRLPCPDRLICREYANNCAPPKKSLSIIHRQKEKESCADGSCNRKNDARFQVLTEDEFSKLQEGYQPVITGSARSGHLTTLKCGGELKQKLKRRYSHVARFLVYTYTLWLRLHGDVFARIRFSTLIGT